MTSSRKPCQWLRQREHERVVIGAFKQAMAEFGIPDHPDGKCPAADCSCEQLADAVEARAQAIIDERYAR